MNIKTWPRKKKTTLAVLLTTVLVLCIACVVFFLQKRTLFHIKPSSVESITFWHGSGGSMEITDREQIDQAIQLLNDFTYDETEEYPPAGGWSYRLTFQNGLEKVNIEFDTDYIRKRRNDGGSVVYYGPAGHFQMLVDLGEEAHERFLTEE
ncbi:MAG: hypothetical protein HFE95_09445 [Acutalibacter sp.]|jgi:hypothetical protein|nr:hypothetical protein [Acutalibacter sp.]